MKDVLKCIIGAPGELYVTIRSPTQQQELFATCSDTDALDGLRDLLHMTVHYQLGWTTFSAMEWKQTLQTVNTVDGALTDVAIIEDFVHIIILMLQFRASL